MAQLKVLVTFLLVATFARVQSKSFESHLMGSQDADRKSFNFQVAITQKWWFLSEKYVGSGALLNQYWVVTSAEVAKHIDSKWYDFGWKPQVKAGIERLDSNPVHQALGVEKVIIHEFYKGKTDNDIALVKVKSPGFVFNELVGGVAMINDDEEPTDGEVTVTGWLAAGKEHKPLQELSVSVIDRESCSKAYGYAPVPTFSRKARPTNKTLSDNNLIDKTLFCVDNTNEKAVCINDIGSPATIKKGDVQALVGVFTMAQKPGKSEMCSTKPAVFTSIAYFNDWIKIHLDN